MSQNEVVNSMQIQLPCVYSMQIQFACMHFAVGSRGVAGFRDCLVV